MVIAARTGVVGCRALFPWAVSPVRPPPQPRDSHQSDAVATVAQHCRKRGRSRTGVAGRLLGPDSPSPLPQPRAALNAT